MTGTGVAWAGNRPRANFGHRWVEIWALPHGFGVLCVCANMNVRLCGIGIDRGSAVCILDATANFGKSFQTVGGKTQCCHFSPLLALP